MTKKYSRLALLTGIISILCNIAPITVYAIIGLVNSDLTHEKVALSLTVFIVLILSVISWVNKITLRSKLWILLIGLYVALDYIMAPLIIIACCQILDECIVHPLYIRFKSQKLIHKEMDKRL